MYRYDEFDARLVRERAEQFRGQVARRPAGGPTQEGVKPPPAVDGPFLQPLSFLPRKFKIAVSGSSADRAAIMVHDIGIEILRNESGEIGYRVFVGGGLGRTPFIGHEVGSFAPKSDILAFLEAVMRVYNESGRRDNIHKAHVKILVHQIGIEEMRRRVENEFAEIRKTGVLQLPQGEIARIAAYFAPPDFETLAASSAFDTAKRGNRDFADW